MMIPANYNLYQHFSGEKLVGHTTGQHHLYSLMIWNFDMLNTAHSM